MARTEHATLAWDERRRVLVFCVVAFIMIAVPILALCSEHPIVRHAGWRMFRTNASRVCIIRYERVRTDGSRERLDYRSMLGFRERATARTDDALIEDAATARHYARELCTRLARDADVRMHLRCASGSGYDVLARGRENECR